MIQKKAEVNYSTEYSTPMDDTFRPESWDLYPKLLGDNPFNDERTHYYFYSKLYKKPYSLENIAGTFSEHRANMNMRNKTASMIMKALACLE